MSGYRGLTPFSFKIYNGGQFNWLRKPEYLERKQLSYLVTKPNNKYTWSYLKAIHGGLGSH